MHMSDIRARHVIYKMEIAGLELHPFLYQHESFIERKDKLDEMINREFFFTKKNLDKTV